MVTVAHYGKVTVLNVTGELSADTLDAFIEQRDQALAQGQKNIVIDCAALGGIDSAGLEAISGTERACRQMGGALTVCALDATGRKIFELTRLDQRVDVRESLEDSVRRFG